MLKWFLIYLSQASWARSLVQSWGFARNTASRFVAGETLDEAITAVKKLREEGIQSTLDHLGEHVTSEEEAYQAASEILEIIDRLVLESLGSGISLKLSQLGLVLDPAICWANLQRILTRARQAGIFVRIDMEDSQLTDLTLQAFQKACQEGYGEICGIVVQSCLYRTEGDVRELLSRDCRIRICKGAYKEPRTVAFAQKRDVDESFDRLTDLLLEASLAAESRISADGGLPPIPAIATHDKARIDYTLHKSREIGLENEGLEFQMLHGIREDLQHSLVRQGYPVRVYVPYGKEWYPYFMRRLAERPANLWFFLSNLLRT